MVRSHRFLYFAYGSNMLTRRLRARTPSARPLGSACLLGHRLAWHKIGRDGSAKCDIDRTNRPRDRVWGVLFAIAESERPALDRAEGLGCGYDYKTVRVRTQTGEIAAGTYYATAIDPARRPFTWYQALVLAGAYEHGLPDAYARDLGAIATLPDPDATRRQQNLILLQQS